MSFPDDEEDSGVPSDDPDLLRNRPLPQRALVIAAGVLANLLLAYLVLVGQSMVLGIPDGFSARAGVPLNTTAAATRTMAGTIRTRRRGCTTEGTTTDRVLLITALLVTAFQRGGGS